MFVARLLTVLAWMLGAGSLLAFGAFLFAEHLSRIDLGLMPLAALSWDAVLCGLFFAQHSLLIRRWVRSSLSRVIPDHYFYLVYTYTSGIVLLVLVILWQHTGPELYAVHGMGRFIFRAVLLLAFAGVLWGIASLARFDAFGIDAYLSHVQQRPQPTEHLTIRGPYAVVRHPFYAAAIAALWATPFLSVDRLLLNVLFTGWILLGARLEERDLRTHFGDEYARYCESVPMFLPRVLRRTNQDKTTKAASSGRAA